MLTLYFARHGETIWNTQSRMQGRLDTNLTDQGISQALALGDLLRGMPIDRVFLSPAPRAIKTARLALQAGQFKWDQLEIVSDERVHEMDLGQWEGMSVDEVKAIDADNLQAFFFNPANYCPTGTGETYAQVSERMASFLDEMEQLGEQANQTHTSLHVLLISHNITLKALLALMRRRPLAMLRDGPPIRQASLYQGIFLADGSWQIIEPENREVPA